MRSAAIALTITYGHLTTAMADDQSDNTPASARQPTAVSERADIDAFLAQGRTLKPTVGAGQRGRLIFAPGASMSRQAPWDTACPLQADMFREAAAIGGL